MISKLARAPTATIVKRQSEEASTAMAPEVRH